MFSVQKYRCDICAVDAPCYDTLVKHKHSEDHIKREKDLEASLQIGNKLTLRFQNFLGCACCCDLPCDGGWGQG